MKYNPLISVIVTTYNRKLFLKKSIDSILNQIFIDFGLIVVDNFSNYDFNKFIQSFSDERIIPFQNQNNGIIAINRNVGIKKAKGEYIAFCDDDDLWLRIWRITDKFSYIPKSLGILWGGNKNRSESSTIQIERTKELINRYFDLLNDKDREQSKKIYV